MAKVISNRRCVMCGNANVMLWTIDNLQGVVATYLCTEHGKPLMDIMRAAGDLGPDQQIPVPERGEDYSLVRDPKMTPLLDWTPPGGV